MVPGPVRAQGRGTTVRGRVGRRLLARQVPVWAGRKETAAVTEPVIARARATTEPAACVAETPAVIPDSEEERGRKDRRAARDRRRAQPARIRAACPAASAMRIGGAESTLPPSPDGVVPLAPGQTVNGTDPFGSEAGIPGGSSDTNGEGGDGNQPTGQGQGSSRPSRGTGGEPPNQPPSTGNQIVHYLGYLNLEFGDGDPNGAATGGVPGAFGSHNWGGWGQAIYGFFTVASVVLIFFGGGAFKAATAGSKLAVTGGTKAAKGFFGKIAGRALAGLRKKWARQIPWTFGKTGGKAVRGATDMFGNIVIKKGMAAKRVVETVLHEGVHRFFSPRPGGLLNTIRARIGMWGYNKSHLLKYLEEALAETVGTGSLRQGLKFPLQGYGISVPRMIVEGLAYLGITVGASYGTYKAVEAIDRP